MTVGVVVLNWEGYRDSKRCLAALADAPSLKVYCVDNGSRDGSGAMLARDFPQAVHIANDSNRGFSGGMNVGLRACLADGLDVIVILNNDAVASGVAIVELAKSVQGRGLAVCPRIDYLPPRDRPWFIGTRFDEGNSRVVHVTDSRVSGSNGQMLVDTATLTGCCLAASAETWAAVGLFNEDFFLIWEDTEWSFRALEAGIRLGIAAEIHISHEVSSSIGRLGGLGDYYFARNNVLLARREKSVRLVPVLKKHSIEALRARRFRVSAFRLVGLGHGLYGRHLGQAPRWIRRWGGGR